MLLTTDLQLRNKSGVADVKMVLINTNSLQYTIIFLRVDVFILFKKLKQNILKQRF